MQNEQKLPLARSLFRFAEAQIAEALQAQGKSMPCTVSALGPGGMVTVQFDVDTTWTLPKVTVPVAEHVSVRWPLVVGTKGLVVSADTYLAQGNTPAPNITPSNLGALVFMPLSNRDWTTLARPEALNLGDGSTEGVCIGNAAALALSGTVKIKRFMGGTVTAVTFGVIPAFGAAAGGAAACPGAKAGDIVIIDQGHQVPSVIEKGLASTNVVQIVAYNALSSPVAGIVANYNFVVIGITP